MEAVPAAGPRPPLQRGAQVVTRGGRALPLDLGPSPSHLSGTLFFTNFTRTQNSSLEWTRICLIGRLHAMRSWTCLLLLRALETFFC